MQLGNAAMQTLHVASSDLSSELSSSLLAMIVGDRILSLRDTSDSGQRLVEVPICWWELRRVLLVNGVLMLGAIRWPAKYAKSSVGP